MVCKYIRKKLKCWKNSNCGTVTSTIQNCECVSVSGCLWCVRNNITGCTIKVKGHNSATQTPRHKQPGTLRAGGPKAKCPSGGALEIHSCQSQNHRGTRVGREPARTEPKPPPSSQPFPKLFPWLWDSSK